MPLLCSSRCVAGRASPTTTYLALETRVCKSMWPGTPSVCTGGGGGGAVRAVRAAAAAAIMTATTPAKIGLGCTSTGSPSEGPWPLLCASSCLPSSSNSNNNNNNSNNSPARGRCWPAWWLKTPPEARCRCCKMVRGASAFAVLADTHDTRGAHACVPVISQLA